MSLVHGRHTVVKVDDNDLSTWTKTSEFAAKKDSHDVTGYGAGGHKYAGGLTDGTFKLSGTYDSTASTGPRAVLQPILVGEATVTVIRQTEGAGSAKPQDSFDWLCTAYTETNPVADMVQWSAEGNISGTVDSTPQT